MKINKWQLLELRKDREQRELEVWCFYASNIELCNAVKENAEADIWAEGQYGL